jgi:hypothetical protein
MIDITMWHDTGPVIGGRGTPIAVTDWNMKKSATYTTEYYPTREGLGAPMVRTSLEGDQDITFPVYTFFKITTSGEFLKNIKISLTGAAEGAEADKVDLFYKLTNVYQEPAATYDGDMIFLTKTALLSRIFYPRLSTVGPHMATSRDIGVLTSTTIYTEYFVTQMRVNNGAQVGNTPVYLLNLSVSDFTGGQ